MIPDMYLADVRSCHDVYIYLVNIFIIVILMYPVINLTHMLNILDMFSLGVTILKICLGHT